MTMGLNGMKRMRRMADLFTAKDGDPQTGIHGSGGLVRALDPFGQPPVFINLFRFTTQPANQIIEADGVNTATFTVATANGVGTVTYQWQLDSGSGFANITDATSTTYETGILTTGDDGNQYRCQATDDEQTITSSVATLQVYATLAISVQPTNQSAAPDETATFSVTATGGFGTKSYQWQLDSGGGFANIGGATSSSYETPTLEESDSGNEYRCVVSDQDSNQVTSDAATLTVTAGSFILSTTGDFILSTTGDPILQAVQ